MFYHAHIYWRNEEEPAHATRIKDWFQRASCAVGEDTDGAVKPHPLPRYQVKYDIGNQQVVEMFLLVLTYLLLLGLMKIITILLLYFQEM